MAERPDIAETSTSPRNHWRRLEQAMDLLAHGETQRSWRLLDQMRRSEMVGPKAMAAATQIAAGKLEEERLPLLELPSHYLRRLPGKQFEPKLRQIARDASPSTGLPSDMILPPLTGNANDFSFIVDASRTCGFNGPLPDLRMRLVVRIETGVDLTKLIRRLERYDSANPELVQRLSLCVSAPEDLHRKSMPIKTTWVTAEVFQLPKDRQMTVLAEGADIVCFLPAEALDDMFVLERVLRYLNLSGMICSALRPLSELWPDPRENQQPTVLADRMMLEAWRRQPFSFHNLRSLAFAVRADVFRSVGGFDPRFTVSRYAATEIGYRLHNKGCYFIPLSTRAAFATEAEPHGPERTLLQQLVAHKWERWDEGQYENPRVSIYIPAFKAARYLDQAIESVLSQDYQSLEICIADDGSPDETLKVLQAYDDDPRVRYVSGPNGGIGYASNRAIALARGMYVGQLDADDLLKPGAVRRLAEYLDENPAVGCVYSSCERIDEQGNYLQNEYSWPDFSREKMMMTSIAHHFRMFRRRDWERTEKFRDDIVNAVDYDMFLKLSEVTELHHIDEMLYQRRWHGENTSIVNVGHQTTNTYVVQRYALERLGLDPYWDCHVPNPKKPREVSYKRTGAVDRVYFWPDYTWSNPYQRLLYAKTTPQAECIGGSIDEALRVIGGQTEDAPGQIVFHLHWLNKLFANAKNIADAVKAAANFLEKLRQFKFLGGRIVWTIHNTLSHDMPFRTIESNLSQELLALVDTVHLHCEASLPEIEQHFEIPREKLRVARHGSYVGCYPDFVTRKQARTELGLADSDKVILFLGQVRPYKGLENLQAAFRNILSRHPDAKLVIAGGSQPGTPPLELAGLNEAERARVLVVNRFIDDMELQLFFRAADMAVFPYEHILTSGSLLLALSYGVPTVVPDYAMTRMLLEGSDAGVLYAPDGAQNALEAAMQGLLDRIIDGDAPVMQAAALDTALAEGWEDITALLFGNDIQDSKEA